MKKLRAFGLLVLVLALCFAFIACDSGAGTGGTGTGGGNQGNGNEDGNTGGGYKSSGGGSPYVPVPPPKPTPEVMTFTDGEYIIEITQKLSNSRALELKDGETYTYKIYLSDGTVISEGTVTLGTSTDTGARTLIFVPDNPPEEDYTFTATLENGVLDFEDESIKDKDGNEYEIPPLRDKDYEGGKANTPPEITNTTVAGIPYSAKDVGSDSWRDSGTHYLIPGTFEAAKALLVAEWGEIEFTSYGGYPGSWTDIVNDLRNGTKKGVLFTTNTYTSSELTEPGTEYVLAVWVAVEIGGVGGMEAGNWNAVGWRKTYSYWDDENGLVEGERVPSETPKTIGVLTYSEKKDYDTGICKNEWTDYILDSTYEAALAKLEGLWGKPLSDWYIFGGGRGTNAQAALPNGVLFQINKQTMPINNGWVWETYSLTKGQGSNYYGEGVGWVKNY